MRYIFSILILISVSFAELSFESNGKWVTHGVTKAIDFENLKERYSYQNCKIEYSCVEIFKYDHQNNLWRYYLSEREDKDNTLFDISVGDAIWIKSNQRVILKELENDTVSPLYDAEKEKYHLTETGWYNIAVMDDIELSHMVYPPNFDTVLLYDSKIQDWRRFYNRDESKESDLDELYENDAIWIHKNSYDLASENIRYIKISDIENKSRDYSGISEIKIVSNKTNLAKSLDIESEKDVYEKAYLNDEVLDETKIAYFENGNTLSIDLKAVYRVDEIVIHFRVSSYARNDQYNLFLGDMFTRDSNIVEEIEENNEYKFKIEVSGDNTTWKTLYENEKPIVKVPFVLESSDYL